VHYHNKLIGEIFGVYESVPLYNMMNELKNAEGDGKSTLLDKV
jgi:hypothetical protein